MSLKSFYEHKIKKIFSILYSIRQKDTYHQLDKCDVLLICHDHDLGMTLDGKAYSPIIDSMLEALEKHGWICRRFALPFSILVGEKAFAAPVNANRRMFLSRILMKLAETYRKIRHQTNVSDEAFALSSENFYFELFKKIECKCIMGIGLSSDICRASNRLGIFSLEILHGIGLPEISQKLNRQEPQALPKGILSFDTISTQAYSVLASKEVTVKQTPHLWLNRFTDENRANLPAEWKKRVETNQKYQKNILITLQWGYDGEVPLLQNILNNGILSEAIIEAIKETENEIFWWIRLHPVQLRGRNYRHHKEFLENLSSRFKNCEWREASSLPLPALLQQCDGHITMISGSAYDASFFGVPTLLLCPTLQKGGVHEKYFSDLKTSKKAILGKLSPKDIIEWVKYAHRLPENTESKNMSIEDVIKWSMGRVDK